jgi:hypothetical protein
MHIDLSQLTVVGGKCEGTMNVTRGKGWLRNLLADIGGLPKE